MSSADSPPDQSSWSEYTSNSDSTNSDATTVPEDGFACLCEFHRLPCRGRPWDAYDRCDLCLTHACWDCSSQTLLMLNGSPYSLCCTCKVRYFIDGETDFKYAVLRGAAALDPGFALQTWLLICNQFGLMPDLPDGQFSFDIFHITEREPDFCREHVSVAHLRTLQHAIRESRQHADVHTAELRIRGLFDAARVQLALDHPGHTPDYDD